MPQGNRFFDNGDPSPTTTAPQSGNRFFAGSGMAPPPEHATVPPDETSSGLGTGLKIGAGALALGALALLARNPSVAGKAAKYVQAARQQSMLSGLAVPKSMLGNVGAAIESSVEGRSLTPLREMLSGQTVKDAISAYRSHGSVGPTPGVNLPGPMPGRIMGAIDEAAQKAMVRAGHTPKEAANRMLQSPLGESYGPMGDWMENPALQYLFPFRRTPFNQFAEGGKALGRLTDSAAPMAQRATTAGYIGAGAVHGAATSDDDMPLSLPLAISMSGRQGLPYGVGALVGRAVGGAKTTGGVSGGVLPVSEYGLDQSVRDPLRPFYNPAAFAALDKIFGGG